jgi:DNA recombination protein RmuC
MTIFLAILVLLLLAIVFVLVLQKNKPADEAKLRDHFRIAAAEALEGKQKSLLDQTSAMISQAKEPFEKSIIELQKSIQQLEMAREGAYQGLIEKLKNLAQSESELRAQTGNLLNAISNTNLRGQWGEMELRRAVEAAGMLPFVDFDVQASGKNAEDKLVRADMVIKLPGGKTIAVDSKVPMSAFIRACATDSEMTPAERKTLLAQHAEALRGHVNELAKRKYFEAFSPSPEFVVLFLNLESSLKAALDADPALLEYAFKNKVIIATPTTLLALLKATAYGWGEATAHQKAQEVMALGKELLERLNTVMGHWQKVGENLERSVKSYNDARASVESRLLVTARKLDGAREWDLPPVDTRPIDSEKSES